MGYYWPVLLTSTERNEMVTEKQIIIAKLKAWESDIDRRATESAETVAAESQDEETCWCKFYESCPACFGKK